jgi:ATP-dependent RNA helicase RhlB
MTDPHSDTVSFASFGLRPEIMQGITEAGFVNCTPIQAQTLPIALAGRDVAGQAQTGTGKTAAFLLAMYQTLLTRPAPASRNRTAIRALIVAPTRELAVQIHHDAQVLGAHTGLKHSVVYGGIDYEKQRAEVAEGCDVLIGTPGRLIDYFKQHAASIWATLLTSATSCAACRTRSGGNPCCFRRPSRTGCSSSPTST